MLVVMRKVKEMGVLNPWKIESRLLRSRARILTLALN